MYKLKNVRKIILVLMAVFLAAGSVVQAKTDGRGSVKIMLSDGKAGTKKNGVVFEYVRIADIVDGEYKELEKYSGVTDLNQINTARELESTAAKIKNMVEMPDGRVETDENGIVEIRDLETGVYLIYVADQTEYETVLPFLVSVPMWDEESKEMNYNVKVIPKHETVVENPPVAPRTGLDSNHGKLLGAAVGLLIAGMVCFLLAVGAEKPYKRAKAENKILQKAVIFQGEGKTINPFEREIDFHALKKINEDIAAWIYIPGTEIDYPVLIGETDSEYLKKNFRGEKSTLGAIFGFSDTSKDFSDAHVCLFGHNMRSPQMFGELKKYKEKDFVDGHQKLYCYTPEGVTEYQLFSVYECEKKDATFEHKMQGNSEKYFQLIDRMAEKNIASLPFVTDVRRVLRVDNKQIITLSCCSEYNRTVNRMTVHFMETKTK